MKYPHVLTKAPELNSYQEIFINDALRFWRIFREYNYDDKNVLIKVTYDREGHGRGVTRYYLNIDKDGIGYYTYHIDYHGIYLEKRCDFAKFLLTGSLPQYTGNLEIEVVREIKDINFFAGLDKITNEKTEAKAKLSSLEYETKKIVEGVICG